MPGAHDLCHHLTNHSIVYSVRSFIFEVFPGFQMACNLNRKVTEVSEIVTTQTCVKRTRI